MRKPEMVLPKPWPVLDADSFPFLPSPSPTRFPEESYRWLWCETGVKSTSVGRVLFGWSGTARQWQHMYLYFLLKSNYDLIR